MKQRELVVDSGLELEAGGELKPLTIAYHTSPRDYTAGEKVVFICHGLTASSDAEDWWPGMVGPGFLFDTDKYYVVCVNILGSPYGSTGPSSVNPLTGKPYLLSFPRITARDVARTYALVCRELGISHIDLLIGASVGGYTAFELCIMYPELVGHCVFLATAPRVSPFITAYNESQRMALEADPTFLRADSLEGGKKGLECARAIALISYRSYEGYDATQQEQDEDAMFASRACSYERHQGEKLSARFDAYSYLSLTYTLDSHNIGRGRGGVDAALGMIKAGCTVIGITSDCVFPPKTVESYARLISGADLHQIESGFGHDGFLLESKQLTKIIKPLL